MNKANRIRKYNNNYTFANYLGLAYLFIYSIVNLRAKYFKISMRIDSRNAIVGLGTEPFVDLAELFQIIISINIIDLTLILLAIFISILVGLKYRKLSASTIVFALSYIATLPVFLFIRARFGSNLVAITEMFENQTSPFLGGLQATMIYAIFALFIAVILVFRNPKDKRVFISIALTIFAHIMILLYICCLHKLL